jgi:colanic acid/amylovoran biosynthesis glycosyltransferase
MVELAPKKALAEGTHYNESVRMVYWSPGPVPRDGDSYRIDTRTLSGLSASAGLWEGDIILLARELPADAVAPADTVWIAEGETPFTIITTPDPLAALGELAPDVATGLHRPDAAPFMELGIPTVLTSEVDLRIRAGLIHASARGLTETRMLAGQAKVEKRMRTIARYAAGLQCNGPAAMAAYGRLNARPLEFHDHRITEADLDLAVRRDHWGGERPLRIAFSGRFVAYKGILDVVAMAGELHRRGAPVEVTLYGAGELGVRVAQDLPPNTRLRGFVEFDPTWKEEFRSSVDLAVLPHPQGDPSMSYFESLGCGVPVLGYANATWGRVARRTGAGWALLRHGAKALADQVETLAADPQQVADASRAGLDYMKTRSFEETSKHRTQHIATCLR